MKFYLKSTAVVSILLLIIWGLCKEPPKVDEAGFQNKLSNVAAPVEAESDTDAELEPGVEPLPEPEAELLPESDAELPPKPQVELLPEPVTAPWFALADHEIIVTTLDELRAALAEDNGYTTVYLGADITMGTSAIIPHINKKSIIIDGISPEDPDVVHTLTESTGIQNITINSNAGTKAIMLRNMTIVGRNYYGTVYIQLAAREVDLTFQNVEYTGPQISYNHYGTLILDNCDISIRTGNGGSPAEEVAEVGNLIFRNKVNINHSPSASSAFYCSWQDGYIEVESGADVTIQKASTYAFYYSGSYRHDFNIRAGAKFRYTNTYTGGTLYAGMTQTAFNSLTIESGAKFYVSTSNAATDALMTVQGPVNVASDSVVEIVGRSTYGSLTITGGNPVSIMNPARFLIYNSTGRPIRFGAANTLTLSGQQINIWNLAGSGEMDDFPLYGWKKSDHSNFQISGTVGAGAGANFTSMSSNYTDGDPPGTAPSTTNFILNTTRVLSVGSFPITVDPLHYGGQTVSGKTGANAAIWIDYSVDGERKSTSGTSDSNGIFHITIQETLSEDTEITVKANDRFLNAEFMIVVEPAEGELRFAEIPEDISFNQTMISSKPETIPRSAEGYSIYILDTRTPSVSWTLSVELTSELAPAEATEGAFAVPNGVRYVDSAGAAFPLRIGSEVVVYNSDESTPEEAVLIWPEDQGIILHIAPGEVYPNIPYKAVIQWNLRDAP